MHLGPAQRIMAAFMLHAAVAGTVAARLPEVQLALDLSNAVFGAVLMGMTVGVVLGSLLMPRLIETIGPKRLLVWGLPLLATLSLPVALVPGAWSLALAQAVFGLVFASANLSINVEADRHEAATGQRIMTRCHGWWAVGFLAVSLAAPPLIRAGVPVAWHFAGLAAAMALLAPALLGPMAAHPPRDAATAGRRFAMPGRGTLLIGAYALSGVLMEGVTRAWSVIYVRDAIGAAEWLAAFALPAFVALQTTGRFIGDPLIARRGEIPVARAQALILLAGLAIVAAAPSAGVAFAGFMAIGLGASIVMPQGFSAAARRGDRPSAEAMGAFATFAALVSFVGPPLFGALAELLTLRAAFALLLPLPVMALVFAPQLGVRAGDPA